MSALAGHCEVCLRGKAWQWGYRNFAGFLYMQANVYATPDHALRDAQTWSGRDVGAIIRPSTDWRAEQAAAEERRVLNKLLIENADRSNARRVARSHALRAAEEGWA